MLFRISSVMMLFSLPALAVEVPQEVREDALRRAQIWIQPSVPVSEANLLFTPVEANGFSADAEVRCKFNKKKPNGLTPKFFCDTPDGDDLKVKPQLIGSESKIESAATRLLNALGFPADRMYQVASVKCKGCPRFTYTQQWGLFAKLRLPFERINFKHAAIERKYKATEIKTAAGEGFAMYELKKVDASLGGAPKAHVDALRLLSIFLAHWDNKSENQRLACLSSDFKANPIRCDKPILIMQDVGQTFGPPRADVVTWASNPIWSDAVNCKVSMKHLPFEGATFEDTVISEEGRQFLAGLLKQLSRKQIRDLFVGARFETDKNPEKLEEKITPWVNAFEAKVKQIVDHPGCPS